MREQTPIQPTSPPPTLKQVAAALGLGLSTVSMALNDHPRIAEATRKRVRETAEAMGYRRNPAFAALGSRNRWARATSLGTPVVLVDDLPPDGWRYPLFADALQGMKKSGERLGYSVKEWVVRETAEWERLPMVLRAQGVAGVVFGQVMDPRVLEHPEWKRFALVGLGVQTRHLPLHTVRFSRMMGARDTVRNLVKQGYRRIAYLEGRHTRFGSEEDQQRWAGVMVGMREAGLEAEMIPPLVHSVHDPLPVKALNTWLRRHRPDVLLSTVSFEVYGPLLAMGWRIPKDFAFACLLGGIPQAHHMQYDRRTLGQRAVEWIDTQLRHGEYGVPAVPHDLVVPGTWHEAEP